MKIAIIFAAGKGKRLNPLTKIVHKSLIKINDLPLIEHLIGNLLTLKSLNKIIVVTGYLHEDFLYLKEKYHNLEIIFNQHYQEYESTHVLTLLPKYVFENDLFIISGDFVMKENCFSDEINDNVMAAVKRQNQKEDWSYKLDQKGNIIDLIKDTSSALIASEWSHITQKFANKIAQDLEVEKEKVVFKKIMIGKYLINYGLQNKISLKPYLLNSDNFWDLDSVEDLERIKKDFT